MRSRSSPIIVALFLIIAVLFIIPVSAYSDDATHWLNQGNIQVQSKNYSQAIDSFDHAIALEPLYFEAWDRKADALNRAGQFNNASAASLRSLEINPNYVQGWINRGQILYNLGYYYEDQMHNMDKANAYYNEQLAAYENAIQLNPNNAEAWFNKGYALAGMKRYDEAITIFDKVQSLDPDYPNLALSQKQARVLRDAAAPVYKKYSLPIIAVFLVIIIGAGYYFYKRKNAECPEDSEPENRQSRRRKER
jgi:tetratricopeptide (TPR) repeat protein